MQTAYDFVGKFNLSSSEKLKFTLLIALTSSVVLLVFIVTLFLMDIAFLEINRNQKTEMEKLQNKVAMFHEINKFYRKLILEHKLSDFEEFFKNNENRKS